MRKLIATIAVSTGIAAGALADTEKVGGITWNYRVVNDEAEIYNPSLNQPAIPKGTSGAVVIPDRLGGAPVTRIGNDAFRECDKLTALDLPDTVTSIGNSAFYCCRKLANINIPATAQTIGDCAFYGCDALVDAKGFLIIYDSLEYFNGTATAVSVPAGVTRIAQLAFNACDWIKSVTIPSGVNEIGYAAFERCFGLTDIVLPAGVSRIEQAAFRYCTSLKTVSIPKSVKEIEYAAFEGCPLATVHVEKGDASRVREMLSRSKFDNAYGVTVKEDLKASIEVKFNANGGVASPSALYVKKGKAVGTLPKATKTGYSFKGWYTKKSGGTKIKTSTKVTKKVTYYAQWTAKKYNFKLVKTGSGKVSGGGKKAYKSKITLKATASKGYVFSGWFLDGVLKSKKATWKTTVPLNGATYTAVFTKKTAKATVAGK